MRGMMNDEPHKYQLNGYMTREDFNQSESEDAHFDTYMEREVQTMQ